MTINDILNSEDFLIIENKSIEYKGHSIEKVGNVYEVRLISTNWLRYETDKNGTVEQCKNHIDVIAKEKN